VQESAEVLAQQRARPEDGDGSVAARPARAGSARAAAAAGRPRREERQHVLAQQKILTQVGQALRAINRQSSDLLETAETCRR
jgi:twitching motility protein PilJ